MVTPPTITDAAEMLWVVLANVSGGDWSKQSAEWQEAAERWRDNYFKAVEAEQAQKAPKHFPAKKGWRGEGVEIAPGRRVVKQEHATDGRHIVIRDDVDDSVIAFTPSQARKLIDALQSLVEPGEATPSAATSERLRNIADIVQSVWTLDSSSEPQAFTDAIIAIRDVLKSEPAADALGADGSLTPLLLDTADVLRTVATPSAATQNDALSYAIRLCEGRLDVEAPFNAAIIRQYVEMLKLLARTAP